MSYLQIHRTARVAGSTAAALTLLLLGASACSPEPAAPGGAPSATEPSVTAGATASSTPSPQATFRPLNNLEIPAPSLEGNLLGDPTEREIWVYLPPQYFEAEDEFPVVYYLPGYGDSTMIGVTMPADLDEVFAAGDPMIMVVVQGVTTVGGSFYVNSVANGDWEQFITEDVVEYVDANFRTIADPSARGIGGHSMGGFGALNLGMRYPEVFGAAFGLAPGVVDARGIVSMGQFSDDGHIGSVADAVASAAGRTGEDVADAFSSEFFEFELAYGLAFASTTEAPYLDYPYSRVDGALVRDDAAWAAWESGFGGVDDEIVEFGDNLSSLAGLGFDCGEMDEFAWISEGCVYLDAQLTEAGIAHEYTVHPGRHADRVGQRIVDVMLPFFAEHLANGE